MWTVLVTLTLGSWVLAVDDGLSSLSAVAMFAIAAFKSELVLIHFMEARRAERHWLQLYRAWIIVVALFWVQALPPEASTRRKNRVAP